MKSVLIRNFFWSEFRKIRTRKNSVFGHFSCSGRNAFRLNIVKGAEFLTCYILSHCSQCSVAVSCLVIYVLNFTTLVYIFVWMGLCNWIWFGCCLWTIFTNSIYLENGRMDNIWCNVSYNVGYSISLGYICMS